MTNWASLAGFKGVSSKDGTVTYMASSFSPKAAINAQLIPPKWNEYINSCCQYFDIQYIGAI